MWLSLNCSLIKAAFGLKTSDRQPCLMRTSKGHLLLIFKMEELTGKMWFFLCPCSSLPPSPHTSISTLFIALLICEMLLDELIFLFHTVFKKSPGKATLSPCSVVSAQYLSFICALPVIVFSFSMSPLQYVLLSLFALPFHGRPSSACTSFH